MHPTSPCGRILINHKTIFKIDERRCNVDLNQVFSGNMMGGNVRP